MVKSYLKYELHKSFGSLCSPFHTLIANYAPNHFVTGTDDSITIWNTRTNSVSTSLKPNFEGNVLHHPSAILTNGANIIYAGYSNGAVFVWNNEALDITFFGHNGAVSSLGLSSDSTLLASGGNDTDIIVWDLVSKRGVSRLKGHLNAVTSLRFVNSLLVSGSKDGVIRVWDYSTNICLQAIVDCPDEIWSLAFSPSQSHLLICSRALRVYNFDPNGELGDNIYAKFSTAYSSPFRTENFNYNEIEICSFDKEEYDFVGEGLVVASGNSKFILFYRLDSQKGKIKRMKKRSKKSLNKLESECKLLRDLAISSAISTEFPVFETVNDEYNYLQNLFSGNTNLKTDTPNAVEMSDLTFLYALNVSSKVKKFAITKDDYYKTKSIQLIIAFSNNTIALWEVFVNDLSKSNCKRVISDYHSKFINKLSISPDDSLILSISSTEIKLWDVATGLFLKNFNVSNAVDGFIIPENDGVFYGTQKGTLGFINLSTCEDKIISNDDEIVRMALTPEMDKFIVTRASGKIEVCSIVVDDVLGCKLESNFSCSDRPTDLAVSRNTSTGKSLIAVSQLDGRIFTYFTDSFKIHLTLYGHKLPISSIDITSDSTLLASCSSDKTLKIWGLDFGNIHKSFTFNNVLISVKWIPLTHYTICIDDQGSIYMHDIDKFQLIYTKRAHCYPGLSLNISSDAVFFITCGRDSTIKVWKITDEQLFPEEERDLENESGAIREDIPQVIPADENVVYSKVTKKSIQVVNHSENLIQVLDEATDGTVDLFGVSSHKHVLNMLLKIDSNDINEMILSLPFTYALRLLEYLADILDAVSTGGLHGVFRTEIACSVVLTIIQVYFRQLAISKYRTLMNSLRKSVSDILRHQMDEIEFNMACVKICSSSLTRNE